MTADRLSTRELDLGRSGWTAGLTCSSTGLWRPWPREIVSGSAAPTRTWASISRRGPVPAVTGSSTATSSCGATPRIGGWPVPCGPGRRRRWWTRPRASWGLAARGALVEAGGPPLAVADLDDAAEVWSDLAPKLYAQAAAGQWDPATAVDWSAPDLAVDVEAAVVQVMTYLVENEQAALMVPARFLGRIHPHFREVIQFLATQVADEARHVEVFTRRASLSGRPLGVSGAGGRASLQTLLDEPDWATASFLLSVLGEGTFLSLLAFLDRWAPDPVTARIAQSGPAGRSPPRRLCPRPPR